MKRALVLFKSRKAVTLAIVAIILLVLAGLALKQHFSALSQIISTQRAYPNVTTELVKTDQGTKVVTKQNGFVLPDSDHRGFIVEFNQDPLAKVEDTAKQANLSTGEIDKTIKAAQANMLSSQSGFEQALAAKRNTSIAEIDKLITAKWDRVFNGLSINLTDNERPLLDGMPNVKQVYPNNTVHADLMDSLPLVGADDVWQQSDSSGRKILGEGVKVGIIDSGIDYTHPDLGSCQSVGPSCRVKGGYDFVNKDNDPKDDAFHGTHVAGIVGSNGTLKGVAPKVDFYSYKVLSSGGGGYWDWIISGIEQSAKDHMDIINLSLGGQGDPDDPISQAVDNASLSGVVPVVSAGNQGPGYGTIGSPGAAREAITVAASWKKNYTFNFRGEVDPRVDQVARFSSRGPVIWKDGISQLVKPDITAPGALICSSRYDSVYPPGTDEFYKPCFDDKHLQMSGTSMAAPHVTGVAALMKQLHPDWSPRDIKLALKSTAKTLQVPIPRSTTFINSLEKVAQWFTVQVLAQNSTPIQAGEAYSVFDQGSGRLDALKAVQSAKPPSVKLNIPNIVFPGRISLEGSAAGAGFQGYSVSVAKLTDNKEGQFTTIKTSSSPVMYGQLAEWDANSSYGTYVVKLSVRWANQAVNERSIINVVAARISQPANLLSPSGRETGWLKYKGVDISGTAGGRFGLTWCKSKNNSPDLNLPFPSDCQSNPSVEGIVLVNNGSQPITESKLGRWQTLGMSSLSSGFYWLHLFTQYQGKSYEYNTRFYLDSEVKDGWPADVSGGTFAMQGQPTIINLGNDTTGKKGLVVGTGEELALYDDQGKKAWSKLIAYSNNDPAVGDIDGDGSQEIIASGGQIKVYRKDGSDYPGWTSISGSSVSLGYFDSQNPRIVIYSNDFGGRVNVVDQDGHSLSGWPKSLGQPDGAIQSPFTTPAIGDVNGDGKNEIVLTKSYYLSSQYTTKIFVYDRNGNLLNSGWPKTLPGLYNSVPSLADVNDDGKAEIILSVSQKNGNDATTNVHILKTDGQELSDSWPFSRTYQDTYGIFSQDTSTPIAARLDVGGRPLIIVPIGGCIYVLRDSAEITSGWPVCRNDYIFGGSPTIANLDGDTEEEIVTPSAKVYFSGYIGNLYALNADGSVVSGFPKRPWTNLYTNGAPIADLDGDGRNDLIYISSQTLFRQPVESKKIFALNLGSPSGSAPASWPQFYHDSWHSNSLPCPRASACYVGPP